MQSTLNTDHEVESDDWPKFMRAPCVAVACLLGMCVHTSDVPKSFCEASYSTAMASISTSAFLGRVLTAKHALAGGVMPSNDFAAQHTRLLNCCL
jgi:hypothetical protein